MERLTTRDEFGNADIIGVDSAELQENLDFIGLNRVTDALNRLADYEDALPLDRAQELAQADSEGRVYIRGKVLGVRSVDRIALLHGLTISFIIATTAKFN